MTDIPKPTPDEMARFAKRHGLDRLGPEHIARMAELSVYVCDLGRSLPRVPLKQDAPALSIPGATERNVPD